jgi:hypothetical protein
VEARDPVSRCNAVISWQNRRATLAGNRRKGRGEIRWTGSVGDESRLCCGVQSFGQTVVATGVFDSSKEHGWSLRSAQLCSI